MKIRALSALARDVDRARHGGAFGLAERDAAQVIAARRVRAISSSTRRRSAAPRARAIARRAAHWTWPTGASGDSTRGSVLARWGAATRRARSVSSPHRCGASARSFLAAAAPIHRPRS
jgi:hypothetical protein